MLDNIKIGTKLIGGFLAVALIIVVVAVFGYSNMRNINDGMTDMYVNRLLPIEQLGRADTALYTLRGDVYKYLLIPEERAIDEAAITKETEIVNTAMGEYRLSILDATEQAELPKFDTAWAAYQQAIKDILALSKADKQVEAINSLREGGAASNARQAVGTSLGLLTTINVNLADEVNKQGDATFASASTVTVVVTLIGLLLAIVIGVVLSRGITGPLSKGVTMMQEMAKGHLGIRLNLTRRDEIGILAVAMDQFADDLQGIVIGTLQKIASGDLSTEVKPKDAQDEIGPALAKTSDSLRGMIASLGDAASNLVTAAAEILSSTTQQMAGASEQSAAIAQTTTTFGELKTISEHATARAKEVASASQRTVEVARSGQRSVQDTIESMTQIKERVEGIAENILALSEQTQQIGEIIATVNNIATQSNMLALNASVEAARAGEHGKGFAVVAVEVRNLAEQSKQATAQVKAILSDIQKATNATVMATEEGTKGVDQGVKLAAQTRESIDQLSGVISESAQAALQMVAGGQQQATGIDQVSLAMTNINQATVQSLASTRQAEKAAQNLNDLARRLTETLSHYRVNTNGKSGRGLN